MIHTCFSFSGLQVALIKKTVFFFFLFFFFLKMIVLFAIMIEGRSVFPACSVSLGLKPNITSYFSSVQGWIPLGIIKVLYMWVILYMHVLHLCSYWLSWLPFE